MNLYLKILIFLYFGLISNIVFSQNETYTDQVKDTQSSCEENGFNYQELVNVINELKQAVKNNNVDEVADMIKYPLIVNDSSPGDPYLIQDRKQFIEVYQQIISEKMRRNLAMIDANIDPFCSWRGAGISNGDFYLNEENNKIKIYVINYSGDTSLSLKKPDYGTPITPITTNDQLQQFIQLLQRNHLDDKGKHYSHLKINQESQTKSSYSLYSSPTDWDTVTYQLYKADINNDGNDEYLLAAYDQQGTLHESWVDNIFLIKGDQLTPVDFANLIQKNLGVDQERWYLFLADPFIVKKNGKYYLRFYDTNPAQFCAYLWQNNKFSLADGPNTCIGAKN